MPTTIIVPEHETVSGFIVSSRRRGGHTEDPVIAGGVLFAAGGIAGNIVFTGPSGTLATEPDSSGNPIGIPNQIIGFAPGDGVVLLGPLRERRSPASSATRSRSAAVRPPSRSTSRAPRRTI